MKTIEDIVTNKGLACEYGYNVDVVPYADVVKYMKLYAEQAIDAAAEKATIDKHFNGNQLWDASVNKQSILKIKEELK